MNIEPDRRPERRAPDLNAGVLAPVADEIDLFDLRVSGTLPDDLDGMLIRNGPNPFDGRFAEPPTAAPPSSSSGAMIDWWVAPAMVHGISVSGGRAQWYRNRWARTDAWAAHHGVASREVTGNPNVNAIAHAGRLLALGEGSPPVLLDEELGTIGSLTFDGALPGMTAHPKLVPGSDELRFFIAGWQEPVVHLGHVDAHGALSELRAVALQRPVMMHDFATTETHDLLLDLNVVYDFSLLEHGLPIPLRWDDDHGARIGAVPHDGSPVRWFDVAPCFIQHVVNAFRRDEQLVLDAVRYPHFLRFDPTAGSHLANPLGVLWRYRLNLSDGSVAEEQLDDAHIELPRIDERLVGHHHRQVFAVEQPSDIEMRGIVRYDLHMGSTERCTVPPGDQNSEPIFIPAADGTDGWLVVCVYRARSHSTDVLVLDAGEISAAPVAIIHLPRPIPAGFHGTWVPRGHSATSHFS